MCPETGQMASKQSLSEEGNFYIVNYEEDGFIVVSVMIEKPIPLRDVFPRAEKIMSQLPGLIGPPVAGGTKPGG